MNFKTTGKSQEKETTKQRATVHYNLVRPVFQLFFPRPGYVVREINFSRINHRRNHARKLRLKWRTSQGLASVVRFSERDNDEWLNKKSGGSSGILSGRDFA